MSAQTAIDSTGVRSKYVWTPKLQEQYEKKRKKLADMGYITDEQVCFWFAENGIPNVPPTAIRQIFFTALDKKPAQRAIDALCYAD